MSKHFSAILKETKQNLKPIVLPTKNHSDDNPVSEVCNLRVIHSTKNGLKVTFLNIDSLNKHIDELRIFSEQHSPHIIYLNETKLSEEMNYYIWTVFKALLGKI